MNKTTRVIKGNIPICMLVTVLFIYAVLIFVENFIFSSSFAILSLRNVDDVAFQTSLYKYHDYSKSLLLFMNDYGYGWIYWFVLYLITYPAHLLFEATGVSWPLIVLPRMYSLFLCILCCILLYKIISIYTENEWIKLAVVIMMPLFPAGAEWAGRFSTVPQVAFFSMLSVWLIVKNQTLDRKKLRYALLAFACAMATKVSAIVVVPLLILITLPRYKWCFSWNNIKVWIQESCLAIFVMLVLMSPIIIMAPLNFQAAKDSISILVGYWMKNIETADVFLNLKGYITFTVSKSIAVILCLSLLLLAIGGGYKLKSDKTKEKNVIYWDYILLPVGWGIGVLYLCMSIGTGVTYVFMYATAISFVMPMGLLIFENIKLRKMKYGNMFIIFIAVLFTCIQILAIKKNIDNEEPCNIFNYFQKGMNSKEEVETIFNMKKLIESLSMEEVNYYVDIKAPNMVYNIFEHDNIKYSQAIWNDLGNMKNDEINLLILSKNSIGFYSDEEFDDLLFEMKDEEREKLMADRKTRQLLVEEGYFLERKWELIYEDENAYIYKRIIE